MKRIPIILVILAATMFVWASMAFAADPPHGDCNNCHALHASLGQDLTAYGAISEVCISCHNTSGLASSKPFSNSMQAVPGVSGTSHRWDVTMDCVATPSMCGPDSQYGLRKPAADPNNPQPDEIQDYNLNVKLLDSGFKVTCAICHDPHSEYSKTWDPFKGDTGTASGGSTTTIQDTSKTWTANEWIGYSVEITSGANLGQRRKITSNTSNTLTVSSSSPFPAIVASGDTYAISGGDFQTDDNQLNQLCEDCHYYRASTNHTSIANIETYDGLIKSHPVTNQLSSVTDPTQYNTAPLEPASASWAPETGARYQLNGGTDTNLTNNILVDEQGKLRCLSCHTIHYADSNASTVDGP